MLKKFACFFFLFATITTAQTTNVTATVTDSDGTLWSNGSVTVQFVPNSAQPNSSIYNINGAPLSPSVLNQGPVTLDGTGSFSLSVYDNSKITPVGSQWQFTVCPLAQSKCGITTTPISGVSQNISTLVDANIPAPRFNAIAGAYGYANVEAILTYPVGGTYWSVTNQTQMYWNGTAWVTGSLPSGISCVGTGSSQVCTFSGAVAAGTVNNVLSACPQTGVDVGAKINAAALAIQASGISGIVDATCFAANQTISSSMTTGLTGTVPITVKLAGVNFNLAASGAEQILPSNFTIEGSGIYNTTLTFSDLTNDIIYVPNGNHYVGIRNLQFIQNSSTTKTAGAVLDIEGNDVTVRDVVLTDPYMGIYVYNALECHFENITIHTTRTSTLADGFYLYGTDIDDFYKDIYMSSNFPVTDAYLHIRNRASGQRFSNLSIQAITPSDPGTGILIDCGTSPTASTACTDAYTGSATNRPELLRFDRAFIESGTSGTAVVIAGGQDIVFHGGYFASSYQGFNISGPTTGLSIDDNLITAMQKQCIYDSASDVSYGYSNVSITKNRMSNCSQFSQQTYPAIELATGAMNVLIDDNRIGHGASFINFANDSPSAVQIDGTHDYVQILDNDFTSNISAGTTSYYATGPIVVIGSVGVNDIYRNNSGYPAGILSAGNDGVTYNTVIASGNFIASVGNGYVLWNPASGTPRRWFISTDTAETGGNSGSNWDLYAYSDLQTYIGTALSFNRASLAATFGGSVSAPAIIPTNITPSTSPVCANGTGGALTTTGCTGGTGGSYLPLTGGTLTGALNGTSASFSGNVAAGATPSALATVAIIGDSLTQTTYGPLLGNAYAPLPSGLTVTNLGDSGQSPGQIAARIGAVPTYAISSTGTIPITGTATMTFTVGWEPVNSSTTGPYLHGTWGGVPGEATYSSGCCAWVPDGTGSPVSVNNIYGAQFIPDQPSRNAVAQIFGMGHNVSQQAPQYVYQNLLASVANVPPWELYAVWSNTYDNGNSASNWSGGQFWTINQQLNAWEQSTFGSHFIDVNTPMLAAYDPTSAVDIEDATIHLVEPSSLRAVYGYGTLTNAISATATSIQMTCVGGSIPLNEDMLVFDTGANQELAFITAASGSCPGTITYTVNRLGIGNNEAHSAGVPAYSVDHLHMATPCIASLTGGNANNPHGWCGGQYIATAVATYVTANYNPSSAQAPAFTGLPDGSARLPSTLPTSTTQSQYGSAGNPVALVNAQIGWFSGNISMGMGIINAPQANFATLNLGNLQNTNGPPLSFFPSGSNYYFSPGGGATVFLGSVSNPFSWIYGGSESLTSTSGGLYGVGSVLLLPSGNAQPANYLIGTGLSGGSYGPKSLASLGLVGTGSANTFTANQTISNSTGPQLTLNNGSGTTLGITQSGSYTLFNASSGSYYDFQIAGKNIAEILSSGAEWLSLGTATSSSGNYNSVSTIYYGSYWNGSSAVSDGWSVGESLSSGTTPTSVFYISKIGGAASWQVQMPNTVLIGATPTVSASQVGFGNSTTASSSCGSLTSSAGCLTINVAGTPHYIPYY